jgi:serine/threonine protein kinase
MQDLIGKTVGPYQILEEIGRGGMAVVYRAWQPSLQRHIALKVLPEYFRHDPDLLARFQREARAAAQLEHPNIVHIYDTGIADGLPYIAMEYLQGGSLQERLAQGTLPPAEAVGLLEQIGGALDHAHARGLIHRDVKPANILFTADGRPKVADFGIARATEGTRLTRTGMVMGTPEYMAPEQAEGGTVDHRADLYALGVILYQMLTGQAPFHGTTPHATLHAVIYEPPPPPRQLNPSLSQAVESVILRALAKRPEERFQRGAALVSELRSARVRRGCGSQPVPWG